MLTGNEWPDSGSRKSKSMRSERYGCDGCKPKADEDWMNAETSWVRGVARSQRDMADDQYARL